MSPLKVPSFHLSMRKLLIAFCISVTSSEIFSASEIFPLLYSIQVVRIKISEFIEEGQSFMTTSFRGVSWIFTTKLSDETIWDTISCTSWRRFHMSHTHCSLQIALFVSWFVQSASLDEGAIYALLELQITSPIARADVWRKDIWKFHGII